MDTTLLCAPVEKWWAGETVWDGFMAPLYVVFLVFFLSHYLFRE